MGRPCDCKCGSASGGGGGGGGGGDGGGGGGGGGGVVGHFPEATSGTGPYKLYSGTTHSDYLLSGVIYGLAEQFGVKDEFIYAFTSKPYVKAFTANLIYASDGVETIVAKRDGTGANRHWDIWHTSGLLPSDYYGTFLGIGSNHVQYQGGRIAPWDGVNDNNPSADAMAYIDDGWYNERNLINYKAAVDGRSFFTSGDGVNPTMNLSCGSNTVGQLGRAGAASGDQGVSVYDWHPRPLDHPAIGNKSYPYQLDIKLGWMCGAVESPAEYPSVADPDKYICVFGNPHSVGKIHANYDPELSSPPYGITPPEVAEFPTCGNDSWLSTGFYGSQWIHPKKIATEYGTGFIISPLHELPAEAFPQIQAGYFKTGQHGWGYASGIDCEDPFNDGKPPAEVFARNTRWSVGVTEPDIIKWSGWLSGSVSILGSSSGWLYMPYRQLELVDTAPGNAVPWTHDEYQFGFHKILMSLNLAADGNGYAWIGNSSIGSELQYYPSGWYVGCEGNPDGSGSFAVAVGNRADVSEPPVASGAAGFTPASVEYSGVAGSNYFILSSAFLPSGLEYVAVCPHGDSWTGEDKPALFYSVYYSGDPMVDFSGWYYRS